MHWGGRIKKVNIDLIGGSSRRSFDAPLNLANLTIGDLDFWKEIVADNWFNVIWNQRYSFCIILAIAYHVDFSLILRLSSSVITNAITVHHAIKRLVTSPISWREPQSRSQCHIYTFYERVYGSSLSYPIQIVKIAINLNLLGM